MALNGHQCCALDLPCCIIPPGIRPEDAQTVTIADLMQKKCATLSRNDALELAAYLLSEFDFVPPGVGKAIIAGYGKFMTKADNSSTGATHK